MVNRRGSLEWNLETIGKLFIGATVLVFVFLLTIAIIGIFTPQESFQAKKNFDMLVNRIEQVKSADLKGDAASLLLRIPPGYAIYGFDADSKGISVTVYKAETSVLNDIEKNGLLKPSSCNANSACICMKNVDGNGPTTCKDISFKTVSTNENPKGSAGSMAFFLVGGDNKPSAAYLLAAKRSTPSYGMVYPLLSSGYSCSGQWGKNCKYETLPNMKITFEKDDLMLTWDKEGPYPDKTDPNKPAEICTAGDRLCSGKKVGEYFSYNYMNPKDPTKTQLTVAKCDTTTPGVCKFGYAQSPCKIVYAIKDNKVDESQVIANSPCQGVQPPFKSIVTQGTFLCNYKNYETTTVDSGICTMSTLQSAGATVEVTG